MQQEMELYLIFGVQKPKAAFSTAVWWPLFLFYNYLPIYRVARSFYKQMNGRALRYLIGKWGFCRYIGGSEVSGTA